MRHQTAVKGLQFAGRGACKVRAALMGDLLGTWTWWGETAAAAAAAVATSKLNHVCCFSFPKL